MATSNLTTAYDRWNKGDRAIRMQASARALFAPAQRSVVPASSASVPTDPSTGNEQSSPLGRLGAWLADEGGVFQAALKTDPDAVRTLLESALSKLPPKGAQPAIAASHVGGEDALRLSAVASYPGSNKVAKAIAYLTETRSGFASLDWGRQNFEAEQWLQGGSAAAAPSSERVQLATPSAPSGSAPAALEAIKSYPGSNDVQRAIGYLSDKNPGFAKLGWHDQNFKADRFLATGRASA